MMLLTNSIEEKSINAEAVPTGVGGGDYSTTNIQKIGVDEPEILKSNGDYLFYYVNEDYGKDSYISIIKTPKKADLSDGEVVKKIAIPSALSNIQLFLQGDSLVILGNRRSQMESLLGGARTISIIYDVSDVEHLVLKKLVEVQGYYQDARIVNEELYIISNVSLDWYTIAYANKPVAFNTLLPTTTEISLKASAKVEAGKLLDAYKKEKN
jgi:uncharacterized secreted protein with C-terminal beta-propeller domain